MKRRDLVAILVRNGFAPIRQKRGGSHVERYVDPSRPGLRVTVPSYQEFGGNLLREIIRDAGKTREEFLERLAEL